MLNLYYVTYFVADDTQPDGGNYGKAFVTCGNAQSVLSVLTKQGKYSELGYDVLTTKLVKENVEYSEKVIDEYLATAGLSAYQIAVKHGYTGTEEEWLASIGTFNGYTKAEVDNLISGTKITLQLDYNSKLDSNYTELEGKISSVKSEVTETTEASIDAAKKSITTSYRKEISDTQDAFNTQLTEAKTGFVQQSSLDSALTDITNSYKKEITERLDDYTTRTELTNVEAEFLQKVDDVNGAYTTLENTYSDKLTTVSNGLQTQVDTNAEAILTQKANLTEATTSLTNKIEQSITDAEGNISTTISESNFVQQSTLDSAVTSLENRISDGITTAQAGMVSQSDLQKALLQLRAEYKQDTSDAIAALDLSSNVDEAKAEMQAEYQTALGTMKSSFVAKADYESAQSTMESRFLDKDGNIATLASIQTWASNTFSTVTIEADYVDIKAKTFTNNASNFTLDASGNLTIGGKLTCTGIVSINGNVTNADGTQNYSGNVSFGGAFTYDVEKQDFTFRDVNDTTNYMVISTDDNSFAGYYQGNPAFSLTTSTALTATSGYGGILSLQAVGSEAHKAVLQPNQLYLAGATTSSASSMLTIKSAYINMYKTGSNGSLTIDNNTAGKLSIQLSGLPVSSSAASYGEVYLDGSTLKLKV